MKICLRKIKDIISNNFPVIILGSLEGVGSMCPRHPSFHKKNYEVQENENKFIQNGHNNFKGYR
jgi:hypothetical protein